MTKHYGHQVMFIGFYNLLKPFVSIYQIEQ